MSFCVTNYHSQKALTKAVKAGKHVFLKVIPFTKEQLKQNAAAIAAGIEPPHVQYKPQAFKSYTITGSRNKQVYPYECVVTLGIAGYIESVFNAPS